MRLDEFFKKVQPLLRGEETAAENAKKLPGMPVDRWALYGHFCDVHRHEILDGLYPKTRKVMEPHVWERTFVAYFAEHPCADWDLNANGAAFPDFLASRVATDPAVAPWMAELADLEWWQWQVFVASDALPEPGEADQLNPTFMARPYTHDVLTLLEEPKPALPPLAGNTLVMLWRTADMDDRMAHATPEELTVVKATVEAVSLEHAAVASGLSLSSLKQAREGMVRAGILVPARE